LLLYRYDNIIAINLLLNLEVKMDFDLQCFNRIRLPALKKLKLAIIYMEIPSINALIFCCPILKILETCISKENYNKICVPPTLKTVKIIAAIFDIEPSLEISQITAPVFGNLKSPICNLQNVVKASFDVFPSSSDDPALDVYLLKLLGALPRIKHL